LHLFIDFCGLARMGQVLVACDGRQPAGGKQQGA
jgi:hypothetical protein